MASLKAGDLGPGVTGIVHNGIIYAADQQGNIECPDDAVEHVQQQAAISREAFDRKNRVANEPVVGLTVDHPAGVGEGNLTPPTDKDGNPVMAQESRDDARGEETNLAEDEEEREAQEQAEAEATAEPPARGGRRARNAE